MYSKFSNSKFVEIALDINKDINKEIFNLNCKTLVFKTKLLK